MVDETTKHAREVFVQQSFEKVDGDADKKGYGPALLELCGVDHGVGEIICKAVRYRAKKNPEDLEKIAAWAYLLWRRQVGPERKLDCC